MERAGTSGVQNISDDPSCPLSVLKTFLTDDLISNIVKFTNTYVALMKQSQVVKGKLDKQTETCINSGLILIMMMYGCTFVLLF